MSRADDLADIESGLLAMRGLNNAVITAAKVLTNDETGFLLVDATAAGFTLTLPPANRAMDVRVQRVDNGGNRLVIQAAGAERILFHTHLSPTGYPFFVLMGAGDFWHLRSDSNGSWRVLDRLDATPLGRPVFETTTAFQPGGWAAHNGFIYNRAEWPWVWDHAQASGMLTTEALRAGKEGMWTQGDGASTFRSPEGRGEFMRMLDESRGIDAARVAGSAQIGSFLPGDNNAADEVIYVHTSGDKAGLGWDTFTGAPASGSVRYMSASGISTADPTPISLHGGAARPRNIAYPGRIKLI
ncbi:phage tail protein [Pseudomonas sp. SWRI74]|uniref:Phage tail protein n=1 Tax=Pseudomonas azerbaijanoccidentalis TaxID=2842347 RepID=A0ABS6QZN0_9PSED|nr:phage tail protein [Pseudomonas azerbaijanoccidentalis]MBV4524385.1 phage tail protein [Pseudomonas azerbaijanoccidentalis]